MYGHILGQRPNPACWSKQLCLYMSRLSVLKKPRVHFAFHIATMKKGHILHAREKHHSHTSNQNPTFPRRCVPRLLTSVNSKHTDYPLQTWM